MSFLTDKEANLQRELAVVRQRLEDTTRALSAATLALYPVLVDVTSSHPVRWHGMLRVPCERVEVDTNEVLSRVTASMCLYAGGTSLSPTVFEVVVSVINGRSLREVREWALASGVTVTLDETRMHLLAEQLLSIANYLTSAKEALR